MAMDGVQRVCECFSRQLNCPLKASTSKSEDFSGEDGDGEVGTRRKAPGGGCGWVNGKTNFWMLPRPAGVKIGSYVERRIITLTFI